MATVAPIGALPIELVGMNNFQHFVAKNVALLSALYRQCTPTLQGLMLQKCRDHLRDRERTSDARCKAALVQAAIDFKAENKELLQKSGERPFRKKKIRHLFDVEQDFLEAEQKDLYGRPIGYPIFLKTIVGEFTPDRFATVFCSQAENKLKEQMPLVRGEEARSPDEFFAFGFPEGQTKHKGSPFGVFSRYVINHTEKSVEQILTTRHITRESNGLLQDPKELEGLNTQEKELLLARALHKTAWAMAGFKASSVDQLAKLLKEVKVLKDEQLPSASDLTAEMAVEDFKKQSATVAMKVDLYVRVMSSAGLSQSSTVKILPLPEAVVLTPPKIKELNALVQLFFKEIAECHVQIANLLAIFKAIQTNSDLRSRAFVSPLAESTAIFAKICELVPLCH